MPLKAFESLLVGLAAKRFGDLRPRVLVRGKKACEMQKTTAVKVCVKEPGSPSFSAPVGSGLYFATGS